MAKRCRLITVLAVLAVTAASCGGAQTGAERGVEDLFHPDDWNGVSEVQPNVYDPVEAGETVPAGFRQILGRDDIAPVYLPNFVQANQISWPDDELVIGVHLEGEARAYPVGFLNRREIVVDMHRGIPTFVTW